MKVRELLTDENKWCKESLAFDKNECALDPRDEEAVSFCLDGAVIKCYSSNDKWQILGKILKHIHKKKNKIHIHEWNDAPERTFADVKQLVEELDI